MFSDTRTSVLICPVVTSVVNVRGKIIRSVLCSIVCNNCAQCNAHTFEQINSCLLVRFSFLCLYCMSQFICVRFSFWGLFCVIDYLCMCTYLMLDLFSSVLYQETGWEEHLQNDLFCVEWDIKP